MRAILATLAFLAGMTTHARSDDLCFPAAKLPDYLASTNTTPLFAGVTPAGTKYTILTNDKTGMWIALQIRTTGEICYLVEGMNFTIISPKPPEAGAHK